MTSSSDAIRTVPPAPSGLRVWLLARPRLATWAAVAIASALPYLGSLRNPPILDDGWTALQNPLVWSLRNVGRIFGNLYGYAGTPAVRGPYRPLTTLSYALNWAVHRDWVPGFHAVNVALHALCAVLVAALARRLALAAGSHRPFAVALLAGLVFAVHPAHVEAVVTIYGRTEPLSAAFALGALLLALGSRGAPTRLVAAVVLLACGILSKEMAVMVPPLYLVIAAALPAAAGLDAPPGLSGPGPRRALVRAAVTALILGAAFLPYLLGHGTALAVAPVARWFPVGTPPRDVALTMSRVLGEYLRILVFPSFLGGDFAYAARIPTLTGPTFAFAVATVAWVIALAAGVLGLRRMPVAGIGVIWIFLALLPVLQIIPVGVLIAERLLYLPSVGLSLAAGWVLAAVLPARALRTAARTLPGRTLDYARVAAVVAVLALLAARTVVRTRDWISDLAFWSSELAKAPREVVVNNNLAVAYLGRNEPQDAIRRLEVALAVNPAYWRSWVNLGIARGQLREWNAARSAFEEAMRLAPGEFDPPRFLARVLRRQGDLDGAIRALEQARRNAPEQAALARELAAVLLQAGRTVEARAALRDAVRLDPSDAASRRRLAELGQ